jgi:hypothetical protein
VNDQRARQLSQPRVDAQGKPIRQAPLAPVRPDPKAAAQAAPAATATVAPAAAPAATPTSAVTPAAPAEEPSKPDPNRKVRAVGPTFLPAR